MGAGRSGSRPGAATALDGFVANPLYVPVHGPEHAFDRDVSSRDESRIAWIGVDQLASSEFD